MRNEVALVRSNASMVYPAFLKRRLCSEAKLAQILSGIMSCGGAAVMIIGIRSLPTMELTEAQVQLNAIAVMGLSGLFIALAMIMNLWRKLALRTAAE